MISAWDIYWVMQLDSINAVFVIAAAVAAVVAFVSLMTATVEGVYSFFGVAKKSAAAAVVLALVSAFTPSTKTAAAMIVIPAIANNQAIQHEASDLYGIAKDALRELAKPREGRQ